MQTRHLLLLISTLLLLGISTTGCRGMQIHQGEQRIDKLEAQVQLLTKR